MKILFRNNRTNTQYIYLDIKNKKYLAISNMR